MSKVLGRFEIRGVLYSKKNSSNISIRNGRAFPVGNPRYNKSKDNYAEQIRESIAETIEGPVVLWLQVWGQNEKWWGRWGAGEELKYSGWDADNKLHSVGDLLSYSGALHDDCQIIDAHVRKMHGKTFHEGYGALGTIMRWEDTEWPL